MGQPQKPRPPLPPIWEASGDPWAMIALNLAAYDPPKHRGRTRIDQRAAFDAVIYRLRSSCKWSHLLREYPDDSSVHRTFHRWVARGVFDRLLAVIQAACEALDGCDWTWQVADTALCKAQKRGSAWAKSTNRAITG